LGRSTRLTSLALRPARVLLLPVAAALALGLAGCKDSPKPEPVTAPKAAAPKVAPAPAPTFAPLKLVPLTGTAPAPVAAPDKK